MLLAVARSLGHIAASTAAGLTSALAVELDHATFALEDASDRFAGVPPLAPLLASVPPEEFLKPEAADNDLAQVFDLRVESMRRHPAFQGRQHLIPGDDA